MNDVGSTGVKIEALREDRAEDRAETRTHAKPMIETEGLTKRVVDAIGTLTILDDITLAVASRETVAIVGASGSGKSTLLGLR